MLLNHINVVWENFLPIPTYAQNYLQVNWVGFGRISTTNILWTPLNLLGVRHISSQILTNQEPGPIVQRNFSHSIDLEIILCIGWNWQEIFPDLNISKDKGQVPDYLWEVGWIYGLGESLRSWRVSLLIQKITESWLFYYNSYQC